MGRKVKTVPTPRGSRRPWFLGLTTMETPNGTSIGTSVFVGVWTHGSPRNHLSAVVFKCFFRIFKTFLVGLATDRAVVL